MSGEVKVATRKLKTRGPKDDRNRTYFTKNNSRFVYRRIPTLEEMIVGGNYQPKPRHECKLHASWTSIQSQDIKPCQTFIGDREKSIPHGQTSPSTISFATLYKATSTAKSNLPTTYEKNPYYKYILEQKRLAEKSLNIEEEQLERLEKENEDEINKIAVKFCKKVQSWDEEDTTVAEALQSLNLSEPDEKNPSEAAAPNTLQQDQMEKLVIIQDLSHLTNPEWVSNMFRICFGTPWSDGFTKVLREEEGTDNICEGLGMAVVGIGQQHIKIERIEADRKLRMEAAKPRVAFGRAVPRAKGLADYEKKDTSPTKGLHDKDPKKQQDLQMDLVTMRAIWGNQLNSRSTKHYCKHLRELIRQKMNGTINPSLEAVTLTQMKPKVLLETGLLSLDYPEISSTSSSLSSMSSLSSSTPATTQKKK